MAQHRHTSPDENSTHPSNLQPKCTSNKKMVQPSCHWLQGALLFAWKIMLRMDALPTFCTACEALEFVLQEAWIESPGRHTTHKSKLLSTTHCFLRSGSTKSIVQPKSSQTGCPALDYHVLVQSGGGGGYIAQRRNLLCCAYAESCSPCNSATENGHNRGGGPTAGWSLLWSRAAAALALSCCCKPPLQSGVPS